MSVCFPMADQHRQVLNAFPATLFVDIFPPLAVARVSTLPWPLCVADRPVIFTTEKNGIDYDYDRLGGSTERARRMDVWSYSGDMQYL